MLTKQNMKKENRDNLTNKYRSKSHKNDYIEFVPEIQQHCNIKKLIITIKC